MIVSEWNGRKFMKKKLFLLILALVMLVTTASATFADKTFEDSVLCIVANGWCIGTSPVYNGIHGTTASDGTYSFETSLTFPGEASDKVVGTIKNRHIIFTRTRPGQFVQKYDGWFFEKHCENGKIIGEMAGTFTSNGATSGWFGYLTVPAPK